MLLLHINLLFECLDFNAEIIRPVRIVQVRSNPHKTMTKALQFFSANVEGTLEQ